MLTGRKERRNKNLDTRKTTNRITELSKHLSIKSEVLHVLNPPVTETDCLDKEPRYNCPLSLIKSH